MMLRLGALLGLLLFACATAPAVAARHDACALLPDGAPRCWATNDEHMPQLDHGRVEVTTLLHVPHDFDTRSCTLVATWSGSETGATSPAAPSSLTTDIDGRVAHWRIAFALPAADAAVRLEQTVTCAGGVVEAVTSTAIAADGAARRVCASRPARVTDAGIHVGDNEITLKPAANVLWRTHGTQWIDRCSGSPILDPATLHGRIQAGVPDEQLALTLGEEALAVVSTGAAATLTADELDAELPFAVLRFDHDLTAADVTALQATLAPTATTLVVRGEHAEPRAR
jgi:hypothetical protein|nr:hypothetical protein [Kofleriaceae bacterium]